MLERYANSRLWLEMMSISLINAIYNVTGQNISFFITRWINLQVLLLLSLDTFQHFKNHETFKKLQQLIIITPIVQWSWNQWCEFSNIKVKFNKDGKDNLAWSEFHMQVHVLNAFVLNAYVTHWIMLEKILLIKNMTYSSNLKV